MNKLSRDEMKQVVDAIHTLKMVLYGSMIGVPVLIILVVRLFLPLMKAHPVVGAIVGTVVGFVGLLCLFTIKSYQILKRLRTPTIVE